MTVKTSTSTIEDSNERTPRILSSIVTNSGKSRLATEVKEEDEEEEEPGRAWLGRKGYHREGACELHGTEKEDLLSSGSSSYTHFVCGDERKERVHLKLRRERERLEVMGAVGWERNEPGRISVRVRCFVDSLRW